jgi:hypothetical protein
MFNPKNRRIFYAIQLIVISCDLQKDIADLLQEIHQGNQLPKRHRRPPARDTPRQSSSKKTSQTSCKRYTKAISFQKAEKGKCIGTRQMQRGQHEEQFGT